MLTQAVSPYRGTLFVEILVDLNNWPCGLLGFLLFLCLKFLLLCLKLTIKEWGHRNTRPHLPPQWEQNPRLILSVSVSFFSLSFPTRLRCMAPGVLCNFQVLYIMKLHLFSFLMVTAEGCLAIIVRTTRAHPATTLVMNSLRPVQNTQRTRHSRAFYRSSLSRTQISILCGNTWPVFGDRQG